MIHLAVLLLAFAGEEPDLRNENLGITVHYGSSGAIRGLVVDEVVPGKPGELSGLQPDDIILGWDVADIARPEGLKFNQFNPPIDDPHVAGSFVHFPPPFFHSNNEFKMLVHRPFRRQTAILTVRSGSDPAPWPSGQLGIIATERPNEPVHLHYRDIPMQPDLVVRRVHPHTLAARLGFREGDVFVCGVIYRGDAERLHFPLNRIGDLYRFVEEARVTPDAEEIVIYAMRLVVEGEPVDSGDYKVRFTPDELR